MAVIRVNKNSNYTVMSNVHLKDRRLSLKAKGLLSVMLSLPDEWDYSVAGLVSICKENETAIKSTLDELKQCGYLVVTKKMPNETKSGRIEYEYDIFEQPQEPEDQEKDFQEPEKLGVENQGVENQGQLNTKESNTKELNTENKKKERKTGGYDEILAAVEDDDLRELYLEYIKMRKLIKSPMTDRALKMLISKVQELEPDSIDRQKQLLETAIMNNWKSVYPLRDAPTKGEPNNGKDNGGTANSEHPAWSGHWL
jgi:hypothetical protein